MSYRLLIADDSKLLCSRLVEMLSPLKGLEIVCQAHTVPETITAIHKIKPHAAILDIRMPGGTGIDVLNDLKKKKSSTKTIIFTNYPYPQYRKKCMECGADYFFDKYTEFEKLKALVEKLANHHNKVPVPAPA